MKELLLTFLFAFVSTSAFSKTTKGVSLGDEYGLYQGSLFIVDVNKSDNNTRKLYATYEAVGTPRGSFVGNLTNEYDGMDRRRRIASPVTDSSGLAPLHIIKYINKEISTYYLYLNTTGSTMRVLQKGVIILFSDGTEMLKPSAKIDVDANSKGNYNYSSFITLTPSELETLASKTIKKFRLFIYDEEIDPLEALKFKDYVSALSK